MYNAGTVGCIYTKTHKCINIKQNRAYIISTSLKRPRGCNGCLQKKNILVVIIRGAWRGEFSALEQEIASGSRSGAGEARRLTYKYI